jgi:hypothetical protein
VISSRSDTARRERIEAGRLMPAFVLIVAVALIALVARPVFAQEVVASGDSEANWVRVDSAPGGESGDQVLEIPQVACDDASKPCDDDEDGGPTPVATSPQTFDDDTASAGTADSDWGNADDYLNQPIYGVPYGYVASRGSINGNFAVSTGSISGNFPRGPRSPFPFSPMSTGTPITQAAQPPLNPNGAWMTPPSMSPFSRPAGSPMASAPFRFH